MYNTETVRALINAFNVHNYARDTVETNFTLQSRYGKDYIVVSFDKSMDTYQYRRYLDSIKRKIIREFYGIEESNDAEILDTAKLIFDVKSFPFDISKGDWSWGEQNGFKFAIPIDPGIIFNLKSHLASSLEKDVLEDMRISSTTVPFNKKKYLCHSKFPDKESRKQFEREFLSRMENRYGYRNVFKNPLKVEGNSVYIKDVFNDARFIDSVTRYKAWLTGMGFHADSKVRSDVKAFKNLIMRFIDQSTEIMLTGFMCASPLDREEASVLMPIILEDKEARLLIKKEADKLNQAFDDVVFRDVNGRTQAKLSVNGSSEVYGIDFSNPEISHCVITKIIESSVINKDHELAIDPRLCLRAFSPTQSPVGVPNGHLSEAQSTQWGPPTRDQNVVLKDSPRRESEKFPVLLPVNQLDVPGTSREFLPRSHLSSSVTNPHSSKCVGATQNVQAGTSQPMNPWALPAPSAGHSLWQPSRPLSWKGANPVGASPWAQQTNPYLSQGTSENKWISSMQFTKPGPSCSFRQEPSQVFMVNESSSSGWKISNELPPSNKLNDKEKELIEALLYTLNLTSYTYGGVYTNFFAKDGKIVSLLHDNVDREEYLQAVINYIMEEYCGDEEEARELYDLDEFPFKLNCEEKQGKTVVANISRGALSNLKILFSQKFGKNVDTIDISVVKKVEKREKNEWVDRQRSEGDSLEEACESCFPDEEAIEEACQDCFPDEGAMKKIPIAFEGGEYVLDRSRDTCEVNLLFKEQLRRLRGTSVKPLTEEEKNLFKELLYWFNSNNYALDPPHTNFIVKNGKIASLIDDSVNVKEYLQEIIDKTKEEYRVNKKEAYDLNEFPFKFLSNCEKNQETTVVANISSDALLNLKKLFSREHKKKVEIGDIDINIVEKAVKSEKDKWVEFQVREHGLSPQEATQTCYPDESSLKYISIIKGEGGYWINRDYDGLEVKSFRGERWPTKGTSKAEKMKSEDNKDSGISSGEATDAENVSSKAEATTSGYESMDCENTRGGSPKRTLELSMENLGISTQLGTTNIEQLCSPAKKPRSNWSNPPF